MSNLFLTSSRRGAAMVTCYGSFWPMDPSSADVDPFDIAHHLSLQCRYNGAVRRFYSVAEHCVLLSTVVSPENALWALLHDAAETYIGDMVRPLRHHLPELDRIEAGVMAAVCERFGLDPVMPAEVRDADDRIIADEWDALIRTPRSSVPKLVDVQPLGVRVEGWTPERAETRYLDRLAELGEAAGWSHRWRP